METIENKSIISSSLINKLLITLLLIGNTIFAVGQVQKPFVQRTSVYSPNKTIYSIKGDFTMIGNTNLTLQNYSDITLNSNNMMILVDADADASTTNSSSSTLTFSTENGAVPTCSNIIYAGLYWTGRTDTYVTTAEKCNIKVKGPAMANYQSFTANVNDIMYPGDNDMYAAYVEVTDLVQQNGIGEYWVADMALSAGNGGPTGFYGGWGMIVIYENNKMNWRDVTVFDGYAYVVGNQIISYDLPVSGFNAVQYGNVNMKLGMMAGEGDVGISGDYFQIQKVSDATWLTLNHSGNSANNFFNSSVYTGGNARNPNLLNNTGMDISMFNIPNANNEVITNNQTSTTFRYGSTQDTYIIFCIAMAVDAHVPEPEGLNLVQSIDNDPYVTGDPLIALPGNKIEYKLEVRNRGTEAINNARVIIPIPYASTYVSSVNNILFSPAPTPNNLYFDPTMGANGSIVWDIGTLPLPANPDDLLGTLVYRLRATTDCNLLTNIDCPPKIILDGSISGTGAISQVSTTLDFIQGYQSQGPCGGVPIYNPLIITIDAEDYIAQNCAGQSNINLTFCNIGNSIPITQVSGNFLAGSHFYNEYPVTNTSIEYTINNPFPATPGTTTYFSVPPGTTNCFFEFTITVTNIVSTPTVVSPVNYCQGATAAPLVATATDPSYTLYYYTSPNGTPQISLTPSTATVGTFTYYVAEGISNSCISPNLVPIIVNVYAQPVVTASNSGPVCYGGTINLYASGNGNYQLYSWTGPNNFTSTLQNPIITNFTNAAAGTYTVTVTNGNNFCSASASTVVDPAFIISVTATAAPILCNGGTTTVSVSATGGTAPYTGTGTFTVGAGTYNYTVTDANGCTATTSITLQEPAPLTATSTAAVITCDGATTNVTVTATGGTAPYTGTGIFTVGSGTYTYTVTDANGCTATTTITVTASPPIVVCLSIISPVVCYGETATVNIIPSGGTPPFTYSVDGGPFQPNHLVQLYAGTHSITVMDANGCTKTVYITITQPTPLDLTLTVPDPILCSGGTTSITASANGGATPYSFSLDNGTPQASGTFTLTAGTHTITVIDNLGCEVSEQITVTEPDPIVVTLSSTPILCFGGTSTITASVTGGTAPYIFIAAGGLMQGNQITVAAGTYTVNIIDANGCQASATITITEPPVLDVILTIASQAPCSGDPATVHAIATGGTAPYTYSADGGPFQNSNIFVLTGGTHTIVVHDANQCEASATITVIQPAVLTLALSSTPILCNGGTSVITATAGGGTVPYSYSLGTGQSQTANTFTVNAGTYTVVVTDTNGCQQSATITITQPDQLSLTLSVDPVLCNGGTSTVTANTSGGTAPYTYSVDGGTYQSSNIFTLTAGGHVIVVKDANGCLKYQQFTITQPAALSVTLTASPILCNGETSTITVIVSGGTAPYTYSLNNGATQNSNVFTVPSGTYSIVVTDANGCHVSEAITIAEPDALELTLTANTLICDGGTTDIVATVTGGTAPYTYSINGIPQSSNIFNVDGGTYTIVVTDANGCEDTETITIIESQLLVLNLSATPILCNGDEATLTATTIGGTAPFTYSLNGGTFQSSNIFAVTAGTYTVVVIDANGCTTSETIILTEPTPIIICLSVVPQAACSGTASVTVTANGGTEPYTYSVDGGPFQTSNVFILAAGNHVITVMDAAGCSDQSIITITVPASLQVTVQESNPVCQGGISIITLNVTGGTAPYTYMIGNTTFPDNVFYFPTGTYAITVIDANNCTQTVLVTVDCPDCNYTTYTQIQWGDPSSAPASPGQYLNNNFTGAFPNGLTIGCDNTLVLTSAQAIWDFLPSGPASGLLPSGTMVNPGMNYENLLAGHIVAATLNIVFDQYDPNFSYSSGIFGDLVIASGDFIGWTAQELLDSANAFIGGCGSNYTEAQYLTALNLLNQSFYNGAKSYGYYLDCYNYGNYQKAYSSPTGIENSSSMADTKPVVFPVPVKDVLNVSWDKGITMIEMYDALGKLVYKEKVDNETNMLIDFSKFSQGVYNIRINNSEVLRIIK
ncbi:MAG TPA: T9SS type A sorting domain-containing protein [Bacteroidales bacterium]|nr:T9SS type A sorting domain-containing protein [Bacteroidales bacterium]